MIAVKKLDPRIFIVSLLFGLFIAIGAVSAAIAQADGNSQASNAPNTEECAVLNSAVTNAVKNQMSIVDMFANAANKNMTRIMSNSCLDALQKLNINLGAFIPDFSLFGALLQAAIDKIITHITDQICEAINAPIGEWNELANGLKSKWNINNRLESWANDVLLEVPGGNAPVIRSENNQGVITSPGTTPVFDSNSPAKCTAAGDYLMCSDGTIKPANNSGSTGSGSTGSGGTSSPYGAQIGANYATMLHDCDNAKSNWSSSSGRTWTEIENARKSALSVCTSALSYYNNNKAYLGGLSAPNIPDALKVATPNNSQHSPNSSSFSLPIRN